MMRRGLSTALLVGFFSLATADVTLAATSPPSPPPQCFEIKDGALPTCEQNPDGTWSVLYPDGGGNLKDSDSTSNSTTRTIEIIVVVAAFVGIGIIAYRTWLKPNRAAPVPPTDFSTLPPARLSGASVEPSMPQAASPSPPEAPIAPPPTAPQPTASPAQQLAELNALRNQGGISQKEYEARRQAIVNGTP